MKCPNCSKTIRKSDDSCKFCGVKIEHIEPIESKPVSHVVYQIVDAKSDKWLVFSVGILSFIVLLETSFGIWYFYIRNNETTEYENKEVNIPAIKKVPINNYDLGETFVFDGFEITIENKYAIEKLDNKFSTYNGKDVIKIPVTIKNVKSSTNSFDIFKYKIFGPTMNELDEVAQYFDEGLFYVHDLKPDEKSTNYLYFLYDGNGKYLIKFEDDNSIKNVLINIDKKTQA